MKFSFPGYRGNLYASVLVVNIASFAIGTHYTWSSPTIPKLQAADSWLVIDDDQASWLGSLTALGTVFGPWVAGLLVNLIGRRRTIMVSVLISFVAWIEVLVSQNVWEIYIGRLLGGLGGGLAFVACPLYVAEISEVPVRAALGSLFALFLIGGYVLEYVVGPYVSYTGLIIVNMVPAVVFFLLIPFTPASPYYYLKKDDESSAFKSLQWLRTGRSIHDVQREVDGIKEEIRISMQNQARFSDLFTVRKNVMGIIIALGIFVSQQIVGTNVILFYAQEIFTSAHTSISPSGSTIVFGLVLFIFRIACAPLVRAFGMKTILIGSAAGTAIFMFILGVYFYLDASVIDVSAYGWVAIATLICYTICLTIGLGPLPWAVLGEIFSPEVKAKASSLCASTNWLVAFIFTKYFITIVDDFGSCVPYFLFSIGSVLALLFVIFMFPDTRGMTLKQVTDMLDGRTIENKSDCEKT